jgi:hypothetical protein
VFVLSAQQELPGAPDDGIVAADAELAEREQRLTCGEGVAGLAALLVHPAAVGV